MKHDHAFDTYETRRQAVFRQNLALMPTDRNSPEWWAWLRQSAWRIEDFDRSYLRGEIK